MLKDTDCFAPGYEYCFGCRLCADANHVFNEPALGYETKNGMMFTYTLTGCEVMGRVIRVATPENVVENEVINDVPIDVPDVPVY